MNHALGISQNIAEIFVVPFCLVFKSYEVLLLCFVRLLASHLKKVFCNLKAGIKKKLPCDFVYQASPR